MHQFIRIEIRRQISKSNFIQTTFVVVFRINYRIADGLIRLKFLYRSQLRVTKL